MFVRISPPNVKFQLTRLMRGVTSFFFQLRKPFKFQLTRLMRGVTSFSLHFNTLRHISTHTPHARRDQVNKQFQDGTIGISTHTPHARRDTAGTSKIMANGISTHTPHARRDNKQRRRKCAKIQFQLTRLMRGVTKCSIISANCIMISTHTPHARRDI